MRHATTSYQADQVQRGSASLEVGAAVRWHRVLVRRSARSTRGLLSGVLERLLGQWGRERGWLG